jgi:predicted MFS family arabinose efflux permease
MSSTSRASATPAVAEPAVAAPPAAAAPHGKILMMAVIAGSVVTNIYCNQPILPLIAKALIANTIQVGFVAGATLLGFATGMLFLLPLGDRYDRRMLILVQIALAAVFATAAALAPSLPVLIAASYVLGIVSCVPQQLTPFAAALSAPAERGRSVGTVVSGIMVGILIGRTISGMIGAAWGWRAVFASEAAFMIPVWIVAASLLPAGRPTTNLSYRRLLASLWSLARDHRAVRESMVIQGLLWACFNAFWVNLAALLSQGPLHLDSRWAGSFGLVGAVGAFAASLAGRGVDRFGARAVIGASTVIVTLAYALLLGGGVTLPILVAGVIVLDLGVQSGLVSNQARAFAVDPKAQGRINTLYMTSTFLGGALGAVASGSLMEQYGWTGVAAFGTALGMIAMAVHAVSASHTQI